MAQESLHDYYEQAREIANVEKELGVEKRDFITIEMYDEQKHETTNLYTYDLPREMAERYDWVLRWRTARFQCQYPRACVRCFHSPYRKIRGKNIGMQDDLNRFIAAKAQMTRAQRVLEEHIARRKATDMFFNEETDEEVVKFKEKLKQKQLNVEQAEHRLKDKIDSYGKD